MSIFSLLLALVLVSVGVYLVNWGVPMDDKVRQILNGVVVILVLLWLVDVFIGFGTYDTGIRHTRGCR